MALETTATGFLERLRFPQLFMLFAALFVLDLFIPDFVPFVDEILLGLLTVMTAMWRKSVETSAGGSVEKPPIKNITPPRG